MAIAPGTRLGPYEILAPIGSGGMGEVYRAKDSRLGRDVAIKVLPSSFSADPERLRRFEQEARAAGLLNHPNITAVYDIGTENQAPYVVTELLEGGTLLGALAGGRLSRERYPPPGPEAGEPLRHQGRPGQDPRLRPREAHPHGRGLRRHQPSDRHGRHGAGRGPGHPGVHVPRTGARAS